MPKLLLINNDSPTWQELQRACEACGFDITIAHRSTVAEYGPSDFDLAILSGGWWFDESARLLRNYAKEIRFIKTSSIPILGICIGMQLMHVAMEREVPLLDEPQHGLKSITVNEAGQSFLGLPEQLEVFKNHTRAIAVADPLFEILALSPGHIEIMKHQDRPLLGVQFHPEVGEPDKAAELLRLLVTPLLDKV